jgi:hypothetical protein
VKVLIRRLVYSNDYTGLEKSVKGFRNTSQPLVPGLALRRAWSEKKFLPWKKSFLEDGFNYSVTRGFRTG